jgi:hypothetical protein
MAGSRSKFTAVDWRGDDSQLPVPTQGDISQNYYVNRKGIIDLVRESGSLSQRSRCQETGFPTTSLRQSGFSAWSTRSRCL